MMTNETQVTDEPKPVEHLLSTSASSAVIPAARHTPLPAQEEVAAEPEAIEPQTTLLPTPQFKTALNQFPRKTKIMVTISPATENGDVLRGLLEAGVCSFRLNLAWVGREAALKSVYAIRSVSTKLQRPISLLLETQLSGSPIPDSPAISESDWADIRFGLECGVDWLAVSAGRDGDAVRQLRQFLAEQKKTNISILARIKNPSALVAPDQIIQDADGIILGDVNEASERPDAEMLHDWRLLVQKCVSARKLVVIVTRVNADVTSALSAQPDALLLSEETSVGSKPLQSVQTLDGLIRQEESDDLRTVPAAVALMTEKDQKVAAAVQQAHETKAEAIVVFTRLGNSASLCAALRPRQSRVFVFTPDARLARRLRLRYALEPIVLPFCAQPKATIHAAEKLLRERKFLAPGAKVVFVTDILDQGKRISSVLVRVLAGNGG